MTSLCSRLLRGYIPAASSISGTFKLERVAFLLMLTLGVNTVEWGGERGPLGISRSRFGEKETWGGERGASIMFEPSSVPSTLMPAETRKFRIDWEIASWVIG